MAGVSVGDDGVARCPWVGDDPVMRAYHDTAAYRKAIRKRAGRARQDDASAFASALSTRSSRTP